MDGFKVDMEYKMDNMESKIDGIEEKMKGNMEYLKNGLKTYMEGLTKLLKEMLPNGEKVLDETHDENKRNINHYFIDSNIILKTQHIPKMDMRKFDGKDLVTWILHMEKYFDLYNVKTHKRYALQLYILNKIHFYGINGFSLIKNLSLGQFL